MRIFILVSTLAVTALAAHEPMVAFLCNKPSLHSDSNGQWIRDEKQDCIKDPNAILEYCKKVFPGRNITNVVHGTETVISDWCGFGVKSCSKRGEHSVTPFRCLEGPFQTDALLVPSHCRFDHAYDPLKCLPELDWSDVATQACAQNGEVIKTYSMLMPCSGEADKFQGAEFVCCPRNHNLAPPDVLRSKPAQTEDEDIIYDDDDSEEYDDDDEDLDETPANTEDSYHLYLLNKMPNEENEHEQYMAANDHWQRLHRAKITQVVKQWKDALQRIRAANYPTQAEMEAELQKTGHRYEQQYKGLEEEGALERRQLSELHQQRIQKTFNQQKNEHFERYIQAIKPQDAPLDAAKVESLLQSYLRVEQKDKLHTLNHFLHLKETHMDEARQIHDRIRKHITLLDERVAKAIEMLSTLGKTEGRRLTESANNFMESYAAMSKDAEAQILELPPLTTTDMPMKRVDAIPEIIPLAKVHTPPEAKFSAQPTKFQEFRGDMGLLPETPLRQEEDSSESIEREIEDEVDEVMHQKHWHHHKSKWIVIIIVSIIVAALSLSCLVFLFVCYRRQASKKSYERIDAVNAGMSPEEYHVYKLQQHGYINPTWEHLEAKTPLV